MVVLSYKGGLYHTPLRRYNVFLTGDCPEVQQPCVTEPCGLLGNHQFSQVQYLLRTMGKFMAGRAQHHKMPWIIAVEHIWRKVNGMQLQSVARCPTFWTLTVSFLTERLFQVFHLCRVYDIQAHMKEQTSENQREDARARAKCNHEQYAKYYWVMQ